jgi:pimeloyl-ACP methyl ester carboxylesterase
MELLSDQWRCVSYDHRGAGLSVVPIEQITLQGCVDDVIGVMDALRIERCIVAAESSGAPIVIAALLRHPERFEGLVFVDGAPPSTKAEQAGEAPQPEASKERPDYDTVVAAFVDRCIPEPESEHLRRWGREILMSAGGEAAFQMTATATTDPLPPVDLSRISVPTLVMHGSADVIVPPEVGRQVADEIPNAQFLLIDGAGHVPTITRPLEVVEAIRARFGR